MGFRIIILLSILISCSKKEGYEQIQVIGHAATGLNVLNSVYHDNSKEGVEFALSMEGCNGVEIDIQLSKDGNLWLYHNVNLSSETNSDGCIPNMNSDVLKNVYYTTLAKEKLVSLEQLDFTFFKGKELFLDLKHYNNCEGSFVEIEKVISKLKELKLDNPVDFKVNCLVSYDALIDPLISEGFSVYFSISSMNEFYLINDQYPNLEGFVVKNKEFSSDEALEIKNNNKKIYIFEIRSPKGIRSALKKNPNGLISDDIRATLIEKY